MILVATFITSPPVVPLPKMNNIVTFDNTDGIKYSHIGSEFYSSWNMTRENRLSFLYEYNDLIVCKYKLPFFATAV